MSLNNCLTVMYSCILVYHMYLVLILHDRRSCIHVLVVRGVDSLSEHLALARDVSI